MKEHNTRFVPRYGILLAGLPVRALALEIALGMFAASLAQAFRAVRPAVERSGRGEPLEQPPAVGRRARRAR